MVHLSAASPTWELGWSCLRYLQSNVSHSNSHVFCLPLHSGISKSTHPARSASKVVPGQWAVGWCPDVVQTWETCLMLRVVKETRNSLLNPDTNSRSCAGGPKISHEPGYLYICLRKGDKDTNVHPPNPWSKKQGVTAIVIVVTVCANCQQVLQGLSVTKGHQLELFLVAALTHIS